MPVDRFEKAVYVDRPKAEREGQVVIRGDLLIAQDNHGMIDERRMDHLKAIRIADIGSENLSPEPSVSGMISIYASSDWFAGTAPQDRWLRQSLSARAV